MYELGIAGHHGQRQLPFTAVLFADEAHEAPCDSDSLIIGDGDYPGYSEEPRPADAVGGGDEAYGSILVDGCVAVYGSW
jgi:hypothetical protein